MNAPITVRPIIPLGPDTVIEGNPYQIAGRAIPQAALPPTRVPPPLFPPRMPQPVMPQPVAARPTASMPDQESLRGLLTANEQDPLAAGLMGMGRALLNYGAPSLTPKGGFMGAIGAGGQGFMDDYQKAQSANLANKLAAYQFMASMQQKPFAVGNRVYDPNTGKYIDPPMEPFNFEGTGERFTGAERSYISTASNAGPEAAGKALFDITKQKRAYEKDLRGEFNKNSEGLAKILGAARRAQQLELRQGKVGVSDLETLYSFITALDPNSVVREGEVALARQISSILETFKLKVDQVQQGKLLPGDVGKDLRARIMELGDAAQQRLQKDITYYTKQEDELALRPGSVVRPVTGFTRNNTPPAQSTNPYNVPSTIGD